MRVTGISKPVAPKISEVQPEDMQNKMAEMMMPEHGLPAPLKDMSVRYTDEG